MPDKLSIELSDHESLHDLGKFSVILGKNGSGKSTILRLLDTQFSRKGDLVRYITPERGGTLEYQGQIDTNQSQDPSWLNGARRSNQFNQFRQSSVSEFRRLEILVLRAIESDAEIRESSFNFQIEIDKINTLLDQVEIRRDAKGTFEILDVRTGNIRAASELSSGESELISLAVEVLLFAYLCQMPAHKDKTNWLLMDEPDVHLHPDLQYRIVKLLAESLRTVPSARVIIATHSTSILSAMVDHVSDLRVGFKDPSLGIVTFGSASTELQAVLPMFGSHPLSSVFNQRPILILEGDDDERIWSQAIRSSKGEIRAYPCVAGDVQSMEKYERAADRLLRSVYENSKSYSFRDRDDSQGELADSGNVIRARLACRTAENLILSDDVLEVLGTDWNNLQQILATWLTQNSSHPRYAELLSFQNAGWPRKSFPLKELRNLIVGLSGSNRPWEVAVGQAIAKLKDTTHSGPNCLASYLGKKIVSSLNLV